MQRVSDYITFEDAAAELLVSTNALRKAVREGRLPSYEILGKTVLLKRDLANYRLVGRADKGRPSRRVPAVSA